MAKEAKKDPQELTVEQKLKALFQLQTMLSKIDEIKTLRGELPLEVQDLEDEIAGLSTRIDMGYILNILKVLYHLFHCVPAKYCTFNSCWHMRDIS